MSDQIRIVRVEAGRHCEASDVVAVEEPLEIRLGHGPAHKRENSALAITMRTPGRDSELALGLLFAEQVIRGMDDVLDIFVSPSQSRVRVDLRPGLDLEVHRLDRHFYVSASCGVCGKATVNGLPHVSCRRPSATRIRFDGNILFQLPPAMQAAQSTFQQTGGLHAAALFDGAGRLVLIREDVGRHNALDKVVGACLAARLEMEDKILVVSGRTSFELVQKTVTAGIPLLAAVGAPSSMAVSTAEGADLTLVGFLRQDRFNVYSAAWRLDQAKL